MEDNTRQLLVALLRGAFGPLTGIAIAGLGFRHARELERVRGTQEDERRWLADRRQAYSRLLLALDEHHHRVLDRISDLDSDVVDDRTPGMLGSTDPRYDDLLIFGHPSVRQAASEPYGHLVTLDVITRRPIEPGLVKFAEGAPRAADGGCRSSSTGQSTTISESSPTRPIRRKQLTDKPRPLRGYWPSQALWARPATTAGHRRRDSVSAWAGGVS
jgi:hypothetical protein